MGGIGRNLGIKLHLNFFNKKEKDISAGAKSWEYDIWEQQTMRNVILAPTLMNYVNSF